MFIFLFRCFSSSVFFQPKVDAASSTLRRVLCLGRDLSLGNIHLRPQNTPNRLSSLINAWHGNGMSARGLGGPRRLWNGAPGSALHPRVGASGGIRLPEGVPRVVLQLRRSGGDTLRPPPFVQSCTFFLKKCNPMLPQGKCTHASFFFCASARVQSPTVAARPGEI